MDLSTVKTERYRDRNVLLKEKWSAAQAARCGFEYGRFTPTPEIAEILGNGIIGETVRAMVDRRWKLPRRGRQARVGMLLSDDDSRLLRTRAAAIGISEEEYASRILACTIGDDMITAVIGK